MTQKNPWSLGTTTVPVGCFAITPGDTSANDFAQVARAIEATVAGNVELVFIDDSHYTAIFAAGERKTGMFKRVNSTNTTATGLIGHL